MPEDPSQLETWSIFHDLVNLPNNQTFWLESSLHEVNGPRILGEQAELEDCLRRVLRPHDDSDIASHDERIHGYRERLDRALEELTLWEIRRQLNLHPPSPQQMQLDLTDLRTLFRSDAFLRYVNAYLYFGIRFLSKTVAFGCIGETDSTAAQASVNQASGKQEPSESGGLADLEEINDEEETRTCDEQNRRTFSLAPPPILNYRAAGDYFDKLQHLREEARSGKHREAIRAALTFLDGEEPPRWYNNRCQRGLAADFELWLRGLYPELEPETKKHFEKIRDGLQIWAVERSTFYRNPAQYLAEVKDFLTEKASPRDHAPIIARLALVDLYWISKLFRAEVSSNGWVHYQKNNWLHLLQFHTLLSSTGKLHAAAKEAETNRPKERPAGQTAVTDNPTSDLDPETKALKTAEETLRIVLDLVLDVVQNSIEVTQAREALPDQPKDRPKTTWCWQQVFDEELDEVSDQRRVRLFRDPTLSWAEEKEVDRRSETGERENYNHAGWRKRARGRSRPEELIGLAFSGGGIRSATLNLGVLQGLLDLDMLRHLDYISTVSGGGFIGSWLVGNVRRTGHWLGRKSDWSESIQHLRKYSNYLAPRTGALSVDTWNLGNSWLRNTFLIQLTGLAWLFVLLLTAIVMMRGFLWAGKPYLMHTAAAPVVLVAMSLLFAVSLSYNLHLTTKNPLPPPGKGRLATAAGGGYVVRLCVLPAWAGACALASWFWYHAQRRHTAEWPSLDGVTQYSKLLKAALLQPQWEVLLAGAFLGICIFAWMTQQRKKWWALVVALICTSILHLEMTAIFFGLRTLSILHRQADSIAFVLGPAVVLGAFAVCVLLLIGLTARNSTEAQREWWTRFGTWLAILASVTALVSSIALFGPWLVMQLFASDTEIHHIAAIRSASILAWLGTVISGTLAGGSGKTGGASSATDSPKLQILATAAGLLFILGSCLFGSTLLYVLLFEILGRDSALIDSNPLKAFSSFGMGSLWIALAAAIAIGSLFSRYFDINIFGFNQFYRNRIVQCYLGATRWTTGLRKPNPFTKFDFADDLQLSRLRTKISNQPSSPDAKSSKRSPYRGPFPILCCTLNLAGSSDLALNTRRGASFTLTPLRCGSDRPNVGYAPTRDKETDQSFAGGVDLGQAAAISGAAVSPNMGYNTSPLVAFLLTMFNVRLGWWFPNPGRPSWMRHRLRQSLRCLLFELFGEADDTRNYVNVCDGGNFENLGIYELVRRGCKLIIASDAECDPELNFGSLGKMIRLCETDFGAVIDLDVRSLRREGKDNSIAHCAVGLIKYCTGDIGYLIYLKASITGDEDVSVAQYHATHPSFPHESTANQFYSEDQFESYRRLGMHMVRKSFHGVTPGDHPLKAAKRLYDVLAPSGPPMETFLHHTEALSSLWEKFENSDGLHPFMHELIIVGSDADFDLNPPITGDELRLGLEVLQLMENAFIDLRLDEFWEHPDNRGWAILFMRWARSPKLRKIWATTRRTFGIRFEYFCSSKLGLVRDVPIVRV